MDAKFQSTEATSGFVIPARTNDAPGYHPRKGKVIYLVKDIPGNVSAQQVAKLLSATTTHLYEQIDIYTFSYTQLTPGAILHPSPEEYIMQYAKAFGLNKTAAVENIAQKLDQAVRTVWYWIDGKSKMPTSAKMAIYGFIRAKRGN